MRLQAPAIALFILCGAGCAWRNVPAEHYGGFRPEGPCVQLVRHGKYATLVKGGASVPDADLTAALGDDPVVAPLAQSAIRDRRRGGRMFIGGIAGAGIAYAGMLASSLLGAPDTVQAVGGAAIAAALATSVAAVVVQVLGAHAHSHALDQYAQRHPRGDCADVRAPVKEPPPADARPPPPDEPPSPLELDGAPPPVPLKLVPELPPPA
jgi:hypothetical protein